MDRVFAEKYQIIQLLGEGGTGKTYEAEDINRQEKVAIKVISFHQVKDWQAIDLLEREAKALANLQHSAIPKYIDYFYEDTPEDRHFYLVRELVTGDSLYNLVRQGWQPSEAEVKEIAREILAILQYLHQQKPAIIHRDLKPQNLIRNKNGKIFLVDFGSVKEIYRQTITRNSTFIGTLGYMPPEQLRGNISFNTDLYALGTTLLFLLTNQDPDCLPQVRMKFDFRNWVNISDRFANWLDKILEPIPEDRFQSAEEALNVLNSKYKFPQPTGSKIAIDKNSNSFTARIPLSGINGKRLSKDNFYGGIFALIPYLFVSFFIFVLIGDFFWQINQGNIRIGDLWGAFIVLPVWGLTSFTILEFVWANFGRIEIAIDRNCFQVTKYLWGWTISQQGKTTSLTKIEGKSNDDELRGYNLTYRTIKGEKRIGFGVGISQAEKDWLTAEIKDFIVEITK